jgi:nitroreductase
MEDFFELARTRRSSRVFKPDPVPDEYVTKILDAARWALSGANAQPWEFIVIKNPETKTKLAEIALKDTESSLALELTRLQEFRQPQYRTEKPVRAPWVDAPLIIAVVGDPRTLFASTISGRLYEHHTFDQNLANATTMIHLAAAALGLGAQWVSLFGPRSESMKTVLGIPPGIRLFTLVPIGYPVKKTVPYRRKLSEIVHYETYDMSKYRSQNDILEYIKGLRQRHEAAQAYW